MPIIAIKAMWDLDEALSLVRSMQGTVRGFQYHIVLGGGVLNNGYSYKDLDLYCLPFGDAGIPADRDGLRDYLTEQLGAPAPLGYTAPDHAYPPDPTYGEHRYTYTPNGKRIDVFII